MNKFLETHQSDIIYAVVVIAIVVSLFLFNAIFRKWLTKKIKEKLPGASLTPIVLINRILKTLWIVLGLIALSFVFIDLEKEILLRDYFRLIVYLGVVAIVTIILVTLSNLWFKYKIIEKVKNHEDPTNLKFSRYVVVFIVGFIGIILAILAFPSLRGVAQTAIGGAGILALIAGFAAQEALANVTGGLFIIAFKPFKIGDRVRISDSMVGAVYDITLRHTVIRNFENKMIVIPNAIINKEKLINYDLEEHKLCELIEIGISYDSNVVLAKKIMQEECENHPHIYDNRTLFDRKKGLPKVKTALIELNDYSVTIRAWAWALNYTEAFALKCDILESVKKRFEDEGVEIPYPYRTIVMKASQPKEEELL